MREDRARQRAEPRRPLSAAALAYPGCEKRGKAALLSSAALAAAVSRCEKRIVPWEKKRFASFIVWFRVLGVPPVLLSQL